MLRHNTSALIKKCAFVLTAVFLLVGAYFVISSSQKKADDHTHFHAGFIVYINGKKQDYSDTRFMHLDVCSIPGKQDDHALDEKDTVHLHDNVGDVAHIHVADTTWGMLFKNMGVSFPKNISLKGYKGGRIVQDILNQPINKDDSVIFVIGEDKDIDIAEYITVQRIREVEGKSNTCEP